MKSSGVIIRGATADDVDAILQCLHTAFEPYRKRYTPEGFSDTTLTPDSLAERLQTMQIFVALDPSGVIGTIACHLFSSQEGHIRGMAVLPSAHGSGIAGQLLARAEEHLRQAGAQLVTLDTTAPLQRAIRFYEKHGYRASGKISDFFGMPLYEYMKRL